MIKFISGCLIVSGCITILAGSAINVIFARSITVTRRVTDV